MVMGGVEGNTTGATVGTVVALDPPVNVDVVVVVVAVEFATLVTVLVNAAVLSPRLKESRDPVTAPVAFKVYVKVCDWLGFNVTVPLAESPESRANFELVKLNPYAVKTDWDAEGLVTVTETMKEPPTVFDVLVFVPETVNVSGLTNSRLADEEDAEPPEYVP